MIRIHWSIIRKSSLTLIVLFASAACGCHRSGGSSDGREEISLLKESTQKNIPPNPLPVTTPTPQVEVTFGKGRRIVPKSVTLKNERWRYRIEVVYPQITGTRSRKISNLNRQIKHLVTAEYRWALTLPTKKDLRYYKKNWPDVYNSVDLDYDVVLATDELLSIYLNAYHYGIGAAHSVQTSFTVNYDFRSGRRLELRDLFKANAKPLVFISRYCTEELSREYPYLNKDELSAKRKNYESWNITEQGIRFNFDACRVEGCAAGEQLVEIPFAKLKGRLKSNRP